MVAESARNHVIVVFPELHLFPKRRPSAGRLSLDWQFTSISGSQARDLLRLGQELTACLSREVIVIDEGGDVSERQQFSEVARAMVPAPKSGDRYVVVAPTLLPLDLVFDSEGEWGDRGIFSHILADVPEEQLVERALSPVRAPLRAYLLLCPMAMDRYTSRHNQDIVVVATELESQLPVEIWLQPELERTRTALTRNDVSWLHIDTHGDASGRRWMIGPTRAGGGFLAADETPFGVSPPLIVLVGCALVGGPKSVGSVLYERGARSVFGPCAVFRSLGVAGSEAQEAEWYRTLFAALLAGKDIGHSVLEARLSVAPGRILKYAWMIVGSSLLSFETR
jgi:hypothetical protein